MRYSYEYLSNRWYEVLKFYDSNNTNILLMRYLVGILVLDVLLKILHGLFFRNLFYPNYFYLTYSHHTLIQLYYNHTHIQHILLNIYLFICVKTMFHN